jgi:LPXTG-motif cell wall-anchored protein
MILTIGLKRRVGVLAAVVALLTVILLVLPRIVQAQEKVAIEDAPQANQNTGATFKIDLTNGFPQVANDLSALGVTEGTTRLVVKPGNSLWSISQELLLSPTSEPETEPATSEPTLSEPLAVATSADRTIFELSERQLLGVGVLVLTFVLAMTIILWKRPLQCDVGGEVWRTPAAKKHVTNYHQYITNYHTPQSASTAARARRPTYALSGSENGSDRFGSGVLTNGQISNDEPTSQKEEQGGTKDGYRPSPAVRSYGHVALTRTAVGRRRKNPLRSRASLSRRRPLRGGWGAVVTSLQVVHNLKQASRRASLDSTTPMKKRRSGAIEILRVGIPRGIWTEQRRRSPRSRPTLTGTSLNHYSSIGVAQREEWGKHGRTSAFGNLSRDRLPETSSGWAVLLLAGAVAIGGGWLLVRRSSSAR